MNRAGSVVKEILHKVWEMVRLHSLRARIFLIILLMAVVPSTLVRLAIVANYEERAVDRRITQVQNQLKIVANHLVTNNYLGSRRTASITPGSRAAIEAELEMLSGIYEGRVMIIGSNCEVLMDTYGISEGKIMVSEEVIRCFRGETGSYYDDEHGYIEMTTPIADSTQEDSQMVVRGVLLTSISDDTIITMSETLRRNATILELMLIVVSFVMALLLSRFLVRPFARLTKAIREVKAGYSNEDISVRGYVETDQISDAFNSLQSRMRVLNDSREEFVANVSHELKTPMTSIKVLSDSLLAQPDAPAELYREFLEDIASEIDRENRIITDLLAMVKMDDRGGNELSIAQVNINELTELLLKRLRPIARKKDVELVFESNREVIAEVDEVKMTLLITNLVENAIKYNRDQGWVRVILDADHQFFTLQVCDSGIGMPQESIDHIFERFYRVDKSHSREIGGTGLGLAICRSVVLMHRGEISAESTEGEGSVFTVKIPLKQTT